MLKLRLRAFSYGLCNDNQYFQMRMRRVESKSDCFVQWEWKLERKRGEREGEMEKEREG